MSETAESYAWPTPAVVAMPAGDRRGSCACGDLDELGDELRQVDELQHGASACLARRPAGLVDVDELLRQLVDELRAGLALVQLAGRPAKRRHDVVEALCLALDVVDDARGQL